MTEPLVVRLSGVEIGELLPDGGLRWRDDWATIAPLNARVLSHSLPFGARNQDAAPFFGGLLPEGIGLERLAREARVASNDVFGLLREVGADVGGSVTIDEPRPPREPVPIDETEYDRIIERAAGYIRGSAVGGGGSAATGVQPKIALTWDPSAERWLLGRGSTPSTHLLKPVPAAHSGRIRAEAYLNEVAVSLGLSGHDARVEDAGERAVLVVERYDRTRSVDGGIARIHQEDAAQALSLPWGGNAKYESVDARASLAGLARLLGGSALSRKRTERDRLLALTVLNVVAGNTDAHAKNFSLLLPALAEAFAPARAPRLADAYDLVPQVLFAAERDPLAMRVNGLSDSGAVTAEDLVAEGVRWGTPRARAAETVEGALRAIVTGVERLGERHGVASALPRFLVEQAENLLRGDRAWTRALPPALVHGIA